MSAQEERALLCIVVGGTERLLAQRQRVHAHPLAIAVSDSNECGGRVDVNAVAPAVGLDTARWRRRRWRRRQARAALRRTMSASGPSDDVSAAFPAYLCFWG